MASSKIARTGRLGRKTDHTIAYYKWIGKSAKRRREKQARVGELSKGQLVGHINELLRNKGYKRNSELHWHIANTINPKNEPARRKESGETVEKAIEKWEYKKGARLTKTILELQSRLPLVGEKETERLLRLIHPQHQKELKKN